jgi:hypothetical protein
LTGFSDITAHRDEDGFNYDIHPKSVIQSQFVNQQIWPASRKPTITAGGYRKISGNRMIETDSG